MNATTQRILIARKCGYWFGADEDSPEEYWHHPDGGSAKYIPDYLNDLNAMHEAIQSQDKQFRAEFTSWLYPTAAAKGVFQCELTAQDWADIFIRVLENKGETK